jgi:crossover junction endodeoxyribonuclease RuvC
VCFWAGEIADTDHQARMITVIGIDPGLADTGIGIVRGNGLNVEEFSFGSIHTPPKTPIEKRLEKIYTEILDVIERHSPRMMVIEDVFFMKENPKSGILLGKVAGVVLLAGSHLSVQTVEISVREAKQILTGNGNASKKQLEKGVRHFLNLSEPIKPYHASDAMALALIGLFRYKHTCQ